MNQGKFTVIVAGGKGLRMQNEIPKQFMTLKGIPVLMHTVNAFFYADPSIEVVLVLPKAHIKTWQDLVLRYDFNVPHKLIEGGMTRFQSVKNGLDSIRGDGVVAIHDGVRPLVSKEIINQSYEIARKNGSAIVAVPSKDSIRKKTSLGSMAVDRNDYYMVQTPQTFLLSEIKAAYKVKELDTFTDDASVYEAFGKNINLIEGDYRNIKLTTPEDLVFAEAFLKK